MQVKISVGLETTVKEAETDIIEAVNFKKSARLTIRPDEGTALSDVRRDLDRLVGRDLALVSTIKSIIRESVNIERMATRLVPTFGKLGIEASITDSGGQSADLTLTSGGEPLTSRDIPFLVLILRRIAERANRAMSATDHPFTVFDLKQALRFIHEAKNGDPEAEESLAWFDVRELAEFKKKPVELKKPKPPRARKKVREAADTENPQKPGAASLTELC